MLKQQWERMDYKEKFKWKNYYYPKMLLCMVGTILCMALFTSIFYFDYNPLNNFYNSTTQEHKDDMEDKNYMENKDDMENRIARRIAEMIWDQDDIYLDKEIKEKK